MIALELSPSSEPLEAEGLAARAWIARALARRLLCEDDRSLAALRGVVAGDLILVFGAFERLPWVDGVQYLGRSPAAPRLFLPTTLAPNVPRGLLEKRVSTLMKGHAPPWALLTEPACLVPVGAALPIARTCLEGFLGRSP